MTTAVRQIKELLPTLSEDELLEVRALLDREDEDMAIIARRIEEIKSGKVECIPVEQVLAEGRAILNED